MQKEKFLEEELTEKIISAFYKVYNTLGFGFLEKVYENSLKIELTKIGFDVESQKPVKVYYDDNVVGDYYADLLVNSKVILELKAIDKLSKENELQLINYLKATDKEIGLLLNFGSSPQIRRKIFTNDQKKTHEIATSDPLEFDSN